MPHLRTGGGNNGRRRPFATGRSKHNNNGMNYNSNSNNNVKYLSSPLKKQQQQQLSPETYNNNNDNDGDTGIKLPPLSPSPVKKTNNYINEKPQFEDARYVPITANELADSLTELTGLIGESPIDADEHGNAIMDEKLEIALMKWYDRYGIVFEDLTRAALTSDIPEDSEHHLQAALVAASAGDFTVPNRVSTALCCEILNKISQRLRHFQHIEELRKELLRSIYREDPDELTDLRSLLRCTPYFEVVRSLKTKVDRLLKERKRFDRAKAGQHDRRMMRKNVLMRTSKNWQMMLLNGAFRQWRETSKNTIRQREMLAKYFRRLKKVTPKDIFVGWKTVTVNSKLDRTTTKKNEKQQELQELERALQLAKKTEGDLMMDMVRMETETKQLRARLGNIRAKIEAQKVPEIREIIVSVGNSLKSMGDVALKNVETIINEIEQSPDPVKFTQMYFIEHIEKSSSKLDAHIEREAKMERAEKKERKSGGRSRSNSTATSETSGEGEDEEEDEAAKAERERFERQEIEKKNKRIKEALAGLPGLPADRLLLRWLKWQLRQCKRGKHPFRRRVDNFKDDLRDGICYGLLLNKLSLKQNRTKLEKEIDPQRRCDIVMAQAARLDPPATGFITTGHMLGGDAILNAAFIGRLYNTHNQLEQGYQEELRQKYDELKQKWDAETEFIDRLVDVEKWNMLRASTDDVKLNVMLEQLQQTVEEITAFGTEIEPRQKEATETAHVWYATHHRVNTLLWEIFTRKVTQDEAEFELIDLRKARQLQLYTKVGAFEQFKVIVVRGMGKSAVVPLDNALKVEMKGIEDFLVEQFDDLRRIFEHYAAGTDGGHSERMSLNEFWEVVKDCGLTKSSDASGASAIKKEAINTIYKLASEMENSGDNDGATKAPSKSQANLDEVEILPNAFIASLIDISFRKFRKEPSLSKRFSILMKKFVLPKACRTNTESFRSEISQDDVQVVYKRHSNNLRKLFSYYAAQSAKAEKKAMKERGEKFVKDTGNEAGINLDSWIRMLRDTKLITRPGDMRHDFPEDNARKVFINVQMSAGDEDDNEEIKSSQSSGDESMIYLEFLEAVAAVACYKYVNPYTPLSTRLETFFKEQLLEVGLKVIKQRKR